MKGEKVNKVILMGRLTKDPEVRYTQSENSTAIASFTVAVDRRFKSGEQTTDFINCIAFGKLGEHVEKYYRKGMKTALTGRIQVRNYTNRDGQKVYVTEVVAEEMEFAESKASQQKSGNATNANKSGDPLDGFMNIPDGIDESLPFA